MGMLSAIPQLIRTGATFERAGALALVLESLGASPLLRGTVRALVWPLRWAGRRGDPALRSTSIATTTKQKRIAFSVCGSVRLCPGGRIACHGWCAG